MFTYRIPCQMYNDYPVKVVVYRNVPRGGLLKATARPTCLSHLVGFPALDWMRKSNMKPQ